MNEQSRSVQQLTRQICLCQELQETNSSEKRDWIIRWHQHASRWMTGTFQWIKVWSDHLHLSSLRITGCLFSTRGSWVQRFWRWKRLPASLAVKECGCICTVPTGTGSPALTSPLLLCNPHRVLTRPVAVVSVGTGAAPSRWCRWTSVRNQPGSPFMPSSPPAQWRLLFWSRSSRGRTASTPGAAQYTHLSES